MPTHSERQSFWEDWRHLTAEQREQFQKARRKLVHDLKQGQGIRAGLRVKRVQKVSGVYEITWAPDGRATFEFGNEIKSGEPHVIWRHIGSHDILENP